MLVPQLQQSHKPVAPKKEKQALIVCGVSPPGPLMFISPMRAVLVPAKEMSSAVLLLTQLTATASSDNGMRDTWSVSPIQPLPPLSDLLQQSEDAPQHRLGSSGWRRASTEADKYKKTAIGMKNRHCFSHPRQATQVALRRARSCMPRCSWPGCISG